MYQLKNSLVMIKQFVTAEKLTAEVLGYSFNSAL